MAGVNEKSYTREESLLLLENEKLKDRHLGQRCFILGTGSSIAQQDLKKLAGEVVISISNFFVHPDMSVISPKYHILPPVFASHGQLTSADKYLEWFADMEEKTFDAEMFFHIGDRIKLTNYGLYKNKTVHWVDYDGPWDEKPIAELNLAKIPPIWSVSETAITVAIYLGFSEIYLLGFDHDWFNGPLVHFYKDKEEHKEMVSFADSEFQMRRHAYIFKKYKCLYSLNQNIFNANANPDSYVDVFPKVNYNSLFTSEASNKKDADFRMVRADLLFMYKQAVTLIKSENYKDALLILNDATAINRNNNNPIAGLEQLKDQCLTALL